MSITEHAAFVILKGTVHVTLSHMTLQIAFGYDKKVKNTNEQQL